MLFAVIYRTFPDCISLTDLHHADFAETAYMLDLSVSNRFCSTAYMLYLSASYRFYKTAYMLHLSVSHQSAEIAHMRYSDQFNLIILDGSRIHHRQYTCIISEIDSFGNPLFGL